MERPDTPALTATQALYDRIAPSYHQWWAPVIEPAALRLLDLVSPLVDEHREAVLVDVGAGSGPVARAAVARWPGVRAIAVDPSTRMLGIGQAEAARSLDRSAVRRLSWVTGVAAQIPVEDGSVDIVVPSFVYQYLHSRIAALRETHRILRPGGAVAVVTWLANDLPFAPWRLLSELLDELHVVRPRRRRRRCSVRCRPRPRSFVVRAFGTSMPGPNSWSTSGRSTFLHCAWEIEEPELLDSLDDATRSRLDRLWQERLGLMTDEELHYRDLVAYVTGERPA